MSITKSYNKQTNTYYAYETTYEWSDEKQKKVQRRRCIGQFDPKTGALVPNGKVGRPSLYPAPGTIDKDQKPNSEESSAPSLVPQATDVRKLADRLNKIEETLQILSAEIHDLSKEIPLHLDQK